MRTGVTLRALAAVIAGAVMLAGAGGCSPAMGHLPGGGLAGYWTRVRLLAAIPWLAFGYLPGRPANAHTALVSLQVGALFEHDVGGDHFCTASVVASPGRDLLITAAHCINGGKGSGYRQDIVFIPDYRDGQAPAGVWTTAQLVVAPQWASSADPDFDVGFVVLKPLGGKTIEQVLGANKLGIDPGYQNLVRVTGYPDSADACAVPKLIHSR